MDNLFVTQQFTQQQQDFSLQQQLLQQQLLQQQVDQQMREQQRYSAASIPLHTVSRQHIFSEQKSYLNVMPTVVRRHSASPSDSFTEDETDEIESDSDIDNLKGRTSGIISLVFSIAGALLSGIIPWGFSLALLGQLFAIISFVLSDKPSKKNFAYLIAAALSVLLCIVVFIMILLSFS